MRVTIRAPFRRNRLANAIVKTKPFVQKGWTETVRSIGTEEPFQTIVVHTPDVDFAERLGLKIEREEVERTVGGKLVTVIRHRMVIPPWMRRNSGAGKPGVSARSRLYQALKTISQLAGPWQPWCGGLTVIPDEVVEFSIPKPDGSYRSVYVHSVVTRILRRMVLDTLQAVIDPKFSDRSHAYRPARSRFTALAQARTSVRQGFHWSCEGDVSRYFDNISAGLAEDALQRIAPGVCQQLRQLATSDCHATTWRKPDNQGRRDGTLKFATYNTDFIKQGDPLAPFLANVVGDQFIDQPFVELMGERARLLRYSDNLLVLARTPAEAEEGIALVEALLDFVGMTLKEGKTKRIARDINVAPFFWLGKILRGGSIQTPEHKVNGFVNQLAITNPASADFKSLAMRVCDELSLDKEKRVEFLRRSLGRKSQLHQGAFDLVRSAWLRRRGVEVLADGEPDDQVAEEILEANVNRQEGNSGQEVRNTTVA